MRRLQLIQQTLGFGVSSQLQHSAEGLAGKHLVGHRRTMRASASCCQARPVTFSYQAYILASFLVIPCHGRHTARQQARGWVHHCSSSSSIAASPMDTEIAMAHSTCHPDLHGCWNGMLQPPISVQQQGQQEQQQQQQQPGH